MLVLQAGFAQAQNRIEPRWGAGSTATAAKPVYSNNSGFVLLRGSGEFKLFRTLDGLFRATFPVPNARSSAFSADNQRVFLTNGLGIFFANVSDGLGVGTLLTDPGIQEIATSRDGKYIAYTKSYGGGTSVTVFDLTTSAVVWSAPVAVAGELAFSADSTKLIVEGPAVFNAADGTVVSTSSALSGPFEVSADGMMVFGFSGTTVTAFDLGTNAVKWTTNVTQTVDSIGLNSVGTRVLVGSRDTSGIADVFLLRVTDGQTMNWFSPSGRADVTSGPVLLDSAPTRNEIILAQAGSGFATAEQIAYTTVPTSSVVRDLSTVASPVIATARTSSNPSWYGSELVAVATGGNSSFAGIQLREGMGGGIYTIFPGTVKPGASTMSFSPSGNRLAVVGTVGGVDGIHVFDTELKTGYASYAASASSVVMADDSTLYASCADGTLKKLEVLPGSMNVLSSSVHFPSSALAISPDQAFAYSLHADGYRIWRTSLSTGIRAPFNVGPVGSTTRSLSFDSTGALYAGYSFGSTQLGVTGTTIALRKLAVAGGTWTTTRVYTRFVPGNIANDVYAASPDGRFVAVGITTLSDGLTGVTVLRGDNAQQYFVLGQQMGAGLSSLQFTSDSLGLVWGRLDAGVMVTELPRSVYQVGISPDMVNGGVQTTGTVELTKPAPTAGAVVTLSSPNPRVVVPASITIPAGSTTGTFTVDNLGVNTNTTVNVSATYGTTRTAAVTVKAAAVAGLSLDKSVYASQETILVTVTLDGLPGVGGQAVALSGFPAGAGNPATVVVPEGQLSATFSLNAGTLNVPTPVTLTASAAGGSATATYTLNPPFVTQLTTNRSTVIGGNSVTGTVRINTRAAAGGLVVSLSDNSAFASVPATVTIPAGATTATFTITTSAVTGTQVVTITASNNGVSVTRTINIVKN